MATFRMHVTHALTENVCVCSLNVPSGETQLATAVTGWSMTEEQFAAYRGKTLYYEKDGTDPVGSFTQDTVFTFRCVVRPTSVDLYLDDVYLDSIRPASGEIAFDEGISYGAIVQNGSAKFSDIAVTDYVPEQAKMLTVTVADSESGERVTGAVVKLGETPLEEAGNGVYTLDVSALKRGTLTVTKAEYQTFSQEIAEDVWSLPAVNVSVSLRGVNAPYTEQTREVGGVVWKVNGIHNGAEFAISEDGSVTMTADPVQDEGNGYDRKIDQTYALRPTQADARDPLYRDHGHPCGLCLRRLCQIRNLPLLCRSG